MKFYALRDDWRDVWRFDSARLTMLGAGLAGAWALLSEHYRQMLLDAFGLHDMSLFPAVWALVVLIAQLRAQPALDAERAMRARAQQMAENPENPENPENK